MKEVPGVTLRAMRPTDRAYVACSWKHHFCRNNGSESIRRIRGWERKWSKIISGVMDTAGILVAHHITDEDTILGWVAVEGDVFHYAYVREGWRGIGVGEMILSPFVCRPMRYTHSVEGWLPPSSWKFEPWLLIGV